MAQCGKAEGQVEIRCNADKIFNLWARNTPQLSKYCSSFPKIELLEGDNCYTPGATLCWSYVSPVGGKAEHVKITLEEIDDNKRSYIYKVTEGQIMNDYYNSWREKIEFTPKGENCTIAKWSVIEYEKKCEDAPHPQQYVDFLLDCIKETAPHVSCA
uniref:Bet v I/Major latex protein domain-containing protein n=1 Tax=Opuntia streptacantha TaxID=393608 RepID=A0A7C8YV17_OPUST